VSLRQVQVFQPVVSKKSRYDVGAFQDLGLLNEHGLPRLNKAIGYFCNNSIDFSLLEDLFSYWRDFSEYIILRRAKVEPRTFKTNWEYVAVKCSKRGNDVYTSRIKKRFSWLRSCMQDLEFFHASDFKTDREVKTQMLWLTLTYDSKRCTRRQAWENIGVEWNRFISAMRRRYGKISVLRSWEAYENGYPHIHALMWFHDSQFAVFPHLNAKQGQFSYRIKEKREFEDLWHSFVDAEAMPSMSKAVGYVLKYQMKVNQGAEAEGSKGVKTLAFMWLFRKRSYSVSGSWRQIFSDLIRRLHNSNMEKQFSLDGNELDEGAWEFIGIFSGVLLEINRFVWACRLNKKQIGFVLSGLG